MGESDIQRTICDYLALKRYFFWRSNSTPIYDPTRKTFRAMPKYARKGVPDILLVLDGVLWGLEVKQKGTYQSPDQIQFQNDLESAGGRYAVVRSLEDVEKLGL